MSRKGSYWSELSPSQGRTPSRNILRSQSGPAPGLTTTVSPKDAWELFITDNIIQEVITCTNLEGWRGATARGREWKNVNKDELIAFIGLTLLAGSEKNWNVSFCELFGSTLHNPMYKATMSVLGDLRTFAISCALMTRGPELSASKQTIWQPSATYRTCSWSTADIDSSKVIVSLWMNSLCHSGGGASFYSTCQRSPPSMA